MTKDKLKSIADWCIKEGTANTRTGKWEITFDELEYRYGKGFHSTAFTRSCSSRN